MGLILDSSVLITAERQGQNARQMLSAISAKAGNTDIAVSVVTLIELAHGAARRYVVAKGEAAAVHSGAPQGPTYAPGNGVSCPSRRTNRWREPSESRLPLSDLLIGVTALELGYSVATGNLRHFKMIPGLSVVRF